jgi:hypothetical protein
MNYAGSDYVMGHILRFARISGRDTLTIDFVNRAADPFELSAPPISDVLVNYTERFWELVHAYGSEKALVQSAKLTLRYDIATTRPHHLSGGRLVESPYVCDVLITDTAGKTYAAHFEGWWYPEI